MTFPAPNPARYRHALAMIGTSLEPTCMVDSPEYACNPQLSILPLGRFNNQQLLRELATTFKLLELFR